LIQIVYINALGCAGAGFVAAKSRRVNLQWPAPKRQKAASGNADTASGDRKRGELQALALYRALTLSSVMAG
jgi:hypothetical protein